MFERFTDKARRVIVTAEIEARTLGHGFIRPEHLLLGLSEVDGVAAAAMRQAGVDADALRDRVAAAYPRTEEATKVRKVPFSPRAKKALELSLREALQLGHGYIGTEHLLLGVLRTADPRPTVESENADVEKVLGVAAPLLRSEVLRLVTSPANGPRHTPAVTEAMRRARDTAGKAVVSTGQLLLALLEDPASQAAKVLRALGVTPDTARQALARVPVAGTSDEVVPPPVTLMLEDRAVTIEDRALAARLRRMSADELVRVVERGLGPDDPPPES